MTSNAYILKCQNQTGSPKQGNRSNEKQAEMQSAKNQQAGMYRSQLKCVLCIYYDSDPEPTVYHISFRMNESKASETRHKL